jgi:hypothetical protein
MHIRVWVHTNKYIRTLQTQVCVQVCVRSYTVAGEDHTQKQARKMDTTVGPYYSW